jgi:hypothetical protein
MCEVDNTEDAIVADATVEDEIGDQLFGLDSIWADPVPYNI